MSTGIFTVIALIAFIAGVAWAYGKRRKPEFDAAIARVLDATRKAGKVAAVLSNAVVAPRRVEQGFRMVSGTTDSVALAMSSAASLAAVREKISKAKR